MNLVDGKDILILDYIGEGGVTLADVIKETAHLKGEQVRVLINSPGGSVFEGLGIYNYLKAEFPDAETEILGLGASIASVIYLAGKTRVMNREGFLMIHNAWTFSIGDSEQLRKDASLLDKINEQIVSVYERATGYNREEIKAMMDAETWIDSAQAMEAGFCDMVKEDTLPAVASFDPEKMKNYKNIPDKFKAGLELPKLIIETQPQEGEREEKMNEQTIQDVVPPVPVSPDAEAKSTVQPQGALPLDIANAIQPGSRDPLAGKKNREVFNALTTSGVTPTLTQEVLDVIAENNIMRQLASIYTIKGNGIVPVPGVVSGAWASEGATLTPSDPGLTAVSFGAWDFQGVFGMSDDLMEDDFYNTKKLINQTVGGSIAEAEGTAMLGSGSGSDRPQGIFNKTADTTTGTSGAVSLSEAVGFFDSLDTKFQPNAVAIMHPTVFTEIAKLQDAAGTLVVDRVNKTINGYKYILSSLAPTFGANKNVVAFGDFKRGYGIAQREAMNGGTFAVKTVPNALAMSTNVLFKARVDGKILDSTAFKVLKIKA